MTIDLIERLLALDGVRYVAVLKNGRLERQSRSDLEGASSGESDRYEELIVNPTLIKLLEQRGNIDCGGFEHVVIRYGSFFQVVVPVSWGHVSVAVETHGDPASIAEQVQSMPEVRV